MQSEVICIGGNDVNLTNKKPLGVKFSTFLYGRTKRFHTQSKLPLGKGQFFLESKPSFTKYRPVQLKLPRLRVFVKEIDDFGIWI